jgi:hypothetical protein
MYKNIHSFKKIEKAILHFDQTSFPTDDTLLTFLQQQQKKKNIWPKKYEFLSCQVTLFGDGTSKIDQNTSKKSSK